MKALYLYIGFFLSEKHWLILGLLLFQSWNSSSQNVRISEETDEGIACYKIETANATYFLDKEGGGLVSLVDIDGNDWISYNSTMGSAGTYRGFPNSGELHPGYTEATTTTTFTLDTWHDSVTVETSRNGEYMIWVFYEDFVKISVDSIGQTDGKYWILYEGTPGGTIESSDSLNLSDGNKYAITSDHPFGSNDITNNSGKALGSEWAYISDGTLDRSLFVAITDDEVSDNYYLMQNNMTVLGFGRVQGSFDQRRADIGAEIVIGLVETKVYSEVANFIDLKWEENRTFASDDFSGTTLEGHWTVVDPLGGASINALGDQLEVTVSSGSSHEPVASGNTAIQVMQSVGNVDFEVEVKFESTLTSDQSYGLIFKESATRFLRFGMSNNGGMQTYSAYIDGGTTSEKLNSSVSVTFPLWLKVNRGGDGWTFSYSEDGNSWVEAVVFTQILTIDEAGIFVGNFGINPSHTALIDYFFETSSPIIPEDGVDETLPIITDIQDSVTEYSATINWVTNESTTGRLDYGLNDTYGSFIEIDTLINDFIVELTGLQPNTQYHYKITATDSSLNENSTVDLTFITDTLRPVTSDDFSSFTLNSELWKLEDPQGGANLELTGTLAAITIPSGVPHDPWTSGNTATRLMQGISNEGFEIEIKLESELVKDQSYGILIEESDNKFLRFDLYHNGNNLKVFSALIDEGSSSIKLNSSIGLTVPIWLKVNRTGDEWTYYYSTDSTSWTTAVTFTENMFVTKAGFYAGNAGSNPEHTALIDYFFNTASPINPEDGSSEDVTPPVLSNINVEESTINATISWTTDEFSYSRIDYGETSTYDSFVEGSQLTKDHSLIVLGLTPGNEYHFQLSNTDGNGNTAISSDNVFTTRIDTVGPTLEVWHGLNQKVGHLGNPQDDFNLMGNVSDSSGIATFEYTLNGKGPYSLSFGEADDSFGDGRRLATTGDYNADILIDDMVAGLNTIELTVIDVVGNQTVESVTVDVQTGSSPLPYTIDWSSTSDPQDVGQYIDGQWVQEAGGVRIQRTGYDRLFLVGDRDWVDYEVTVPITIHNMDAETGPNSGANGLGLIMRFTGHIVGGHRNWPEAQPKWGYQPLGAIGWLRGAGTTLNKQFYRGDNDNTVNNGTFNITLGNTYWMKMRCVTLPDAGNLGVTEYSWKIWQDGETEPINWDWQIEQQSEHALRNGGVALVAHHFDATFGDLQVTQITDPSDDLGPVLSGIVSTPGINSTDITWETDEYALGKVKFGRTSSYSDSLRLDEIDTLHAIKLTNLSPGTEYHFQIVSADANGNRSESSDFTFLTEDLIQIISDDFNNDTLNTSLWELEDPVGGATVSMTGTQVSITIPAGISHDPWTGGNNATRLMQESSDVDFEVEVKYESALVEDQSYGIMIKETDGKYLRFDIYNNAGDTRIFAAYLDGSSSFIKVNNSISVTNPVWFRVNRIEDNWTFYYSFDGIFWTESISFSQELIVTEVGPYLGNFGNNPEHTAVIDYFINTAPVISGNRTLSTEENTTIVETYSADESVSWSLSGTDGDLFTISTLGALSFTSSPDFENSLDTDGDNVYLLDLTATDASNNATTVELAITVTDVDEIAPILSGDATPSVEENQTVVASYTNNEGGSWTLSGVDASLFSITGGALSFLAAPDYESSADDDGNNVYEVVVEATDASLNVGTLSVSVTVTDVDEIAPVIDNLNVEIISNTAVITWVTTEPAQSLIEYDLSDDLLTSISIADNEFKESHQIILEGLEQGVKYFYYLSVFDSLGNRTETEIDSFQTLIPLNVKDTLSLLVSDPFPNPFNEIAQFTISGYPQNQNLNIQIYDISGRPIKTIFDGNLETREKWTFEFDGREIPSGPYFIVIEGESLYKILRVIVSH